MAGISDRVTITITRNTRTPSKASFGTPLLFGYHAHNTDLYRVYSNLDEMVTDSFAIYEPLYRMAVAVFAQSPRPEQIVVGRLTAAHTHTQTVTITSSTEGDVVKLKVVDPTSGTVTALSYTIGSAATTTTVAAAVELLIEAVTGVASDSTGAVITVTPATAGKVVYIYDLQNCTLADTTADSNYDDDLAALKLVTPATAAWYTVCLDTQSKANGDKVATFAEANGVLFFAQTSNSVEASGSSAYAAGLQTSAFARTAIIYHERLDQYIACAWVGYCLPKAPGSINWAIKGLNGIAVSNLTSTQEGNLKTAGCNYYTQINGINQIDGKNGGGRMSSGDPIDIISGTDWLKSEIQAAALGYLASHDKVDFDDFTGKAVEQFIEGVFARAITARLIEAGSVTVTATKVADMTDQQKSDREFGPTRFSGTYTGAVNKFTFNGTLSL